MGTPDLWVRRSDRFLPSRRRHEPFSLHFGRGAVQNIYCTEQIPYCAVQNLYYAVQILYSQNEFSEPLAPLLDL